MMNIQTTMTFDNGYGVSIINHGLGAKQRLLELAVLHTTNGREAMCFRTPITDDVIGWLTPDEALDIALKVEALPVNNLCGHIADRSGR